MMLICRFQIFFFLCFISISPIFSAQAGGEYGATWSDTLNIGHPSIKLRTGPKGNTTTLSEDAMHEFPFDIDTVHKQLNERIAELKIATGDHNVVVAGISMLVQVDDHYEAFFQLLQDEKGLPLAFVSGSVPRRFSNKKYTFVNASDSFDPTDLFQRFGERVEQFRDPLLQRAEIEHYHRIWEKSLTEPLEKAKTEVGSILARTFSSAQELTKAIQPSLQSSCQESNESFGSSTDSEQYFLQYLAREVTPLGSEARPVLVRECEKLRDDYVIQKMNFFKHRLFNTLNIDALIEGTGQLREDLLKFKNAKEVGYILHLHSTREICRCCSVSLAQDLVHGQLSDAVKRIVTKRNDDSGIDPFFLVLSSCSFLMTNPRSESEVYTRQGIGSDNRLSSEYYEEETVTIDKIIGQKIFLQKLFSKEKTK